MWHTFLLLIKFFIEIQMYITRETFTDVFCHGYTSINTIILLPAIHYFCLHNIYPLQHSFVDSKLWNLIISMCIKHLCCAIILFIEFNLIHTFSGLHSWGSFTTGCTRRDFLAARQWLLDEGWNWNGYITVLLNVPNNISSTLIQTLFQQKKMNSVEKNIAAPTILPIAW